MNVSNSLRIVVLSQQIRLTQKPGHSAVDALECCVPNRATGDEDHIPTGSDLVVPQPYSLAQKSLGAIPNDRLADAAADGEPIAVVIQIVGQCTQDGELITP